jgi:FkbM family methyltransferase
LATSLLLSSPFKNPLADMGGITSFLYRLKWAIGYRLIGPSSWTGPIRRRLSYERWLTSHAKGWPRFLLWRLGLKVPFHVSVAGQQYHIQNEAQRAEFSKYARDVYQPFPFEEERLGRRAGVFRFSFRGKRLAFPYNETRDGTSVVLREFFLGEPWGGLDVEGKDVVDIGASIGETAIYFCLKGARRVIALEPYPAAYERARQNILANGFDDKVTLVNEGAGTSGWMKLSRSETNLWANAIPSSDGLEVRFNSLKDIITRFGIKTASLKLHGEGCEYALLENASPEDLAHFPQIVMKYHYGATQILKNLKSAGFEITRHWNLHFSYNPKSPNPNYEAGFILAKQAGGPSN